MADILEDIKEQLQLEYVSDLNIIERPRIQAVLHQLDLNSYPFSQLVDCYQYLFNDHREFKSKEEIMTSLLQS